MINSFEYNCVLDEGFGYYSQRGIPKINPANKYARYFENPLKKLDYLPLCRVGVFLPSIGYTVRLVALGFSNRSSSRSA